ncbi:HAD family hydrolase [Saccharothrix obliqua]|uniref:HAD family hydrolase n=1 Tax=Saccharothrix obliqua TaxID=2861747 RepID=UPI001C5E6583|nr:HAD-IA family hydrolase [Saccharothrix obliqua]MBW4719857.1 HAD-IA family hydrolase [Saccharothrix obliqua]
MRAVIFDWRGTLVLAPTFRRWATAALRRSGRDETAAADLAAVLAGLPAPPPEADADPVLHRASYYGAFAAAGLPDELADALYAVESDPAFTPFADDAAATLHALHDRGVRVGVLSDIHFDIRPAFAGLPVDAFTLSCETGLVKPDPAAFHAALAALDVEPDEALVVGDRASHDGAAVEVGMTALLVPPLLDVAERRLHRVTDLVGPNRGWRGPSR